MKRIGFAGPGRTGSPAAARLRLPGTELDVSRLCLGGNRLGTELDGEASFALLDAFREAGGNFVDTARVYADWIDGAERSASEKTLGRWMDARGVRDEVVVATKGGHPPLDAPHRHRLDAASLRADANASRENLGVDTIPLFYVHRDREALPAVRIVEALEGLRDDGLIRHYAASNWRSERLEEAARAAERHGWQGFVANQPEWSLARRNPGTAPADLVAMDDRAFAWHERSGTVAVPYSPQARGYFDKVAAGRLDEATEAAYDNAANRTVSRALSSLADELGATPTQVALATLLAAPFPVVPVIGCRTSEQVLASFASLTVELSPERRDALRTARDDTHVRRIEGTSPQHAPRENTR